jgi:hypothetical protein
LTLLSSSVRTDADGTDYQRSVDDSRFKDDYSSIQSIVTSGAQADTGLFETNLRDERYLPVEGAGAISTWRLELPSEIRQFDYDTISDVILHVRYTARDGGALLRGKAIASLRDIIAKGTAAGSIRLFSVRHEFPAAWARFQSQTPGKNQGYALSLNLCPEHYSFWSQAYIDNGSSKVTRLDILAQSTGTSVPDSIKVFNNVDRSGKIESLHQDASYGKLLVGRLVENPPPQKPVTTLQLFFDTNALSDMWIAVTWSS